MKVKSDDGYTFSSVELYANSAKQMIKARGVSLSVDYDDHGNPYDIGVRVFGDVVHEIILGHTHLGDIEYITAPSICQVSREVLCKLITINEVDPLPLFQAIQED